jgi:hypothetical protein
LPELALLCNGLLDDCVGGVDLNGLGVSLWLA